MTPITWVDANGFLSFVLNVAGNLFLAWKWRSGWVVRIVAIVSWGIYGWQIASKPIILNAATFFCINVYGFCRWRREEREPPKTSEQLEKEKYEKWFEEQRRSA